MSDDISLAMEGALAVVAVVGVYCLVVFFDGSTRELNSLRYGNSHIG